MRDWFDYNSSYFIIIIGVILDNIKRITKSVYTQYNELPANQHNVLLSSMLL